jgi:hypothetical protein
VRLIAIAIANKTVPIALAQPHYWSEAKFFRHVLGCGWRYGKDLRVLKVITPDAFVDGAPVYLATAEANQRHTRAVTKYEEAERRAVNNL